MSQQDGAAPTPSRYIADLWWRIGQVECLDCPRAQEQGRGLQPEERVQKVLTFSRSFLFIYCFRHSDSFSRYEKSRHSQQGGRYSDQFNRSNSGRFSHHRPGPPGHHRSVSLHIRQSVTGLLAGNIPFTSTGVTTITNTTAPTSSEDNQVIIEDIYYWEYFMELSILEWYNQEFTFKPSSITS